MSEQQRPPALSHLHFVQSLEPLQGGGLGAAARQLNAALVKSGSPSWLLSTKAREFSSTWPDVEQFPRRGPERTFFAFGLRERAEQILAGNDDPTFFHGHGFYVYPNAALGSLARRRGQPLVYHPHGMLEPWILRRSQWKKRLSHWLFENANFRAAKLWRALTSKEADQIREQGITAPVVVLPNGIDSDEYRPLVEKPPKPERTMLFLGRIHPKKGIDLLLAAWARLPQERKGWKLCLVGPDEAGYAATVAGMIATHGLSDSVVMAGSLVGPAKRAALQEAEAFVLTSYSEGLPMAVLEAMSCGVPVLITKECNLPEVADTGAGWTCEAEQTSVDNALRALLTADDLERRQRGALGRALVERRFRWEAIATELVRACEKSL